MFFGIKGSINTWRKGYGKQMLRGLRLWVLAACNVSFYPLPSKYIYDIPTTWSIRRWFSITVMDRMESRERPMNGEKRAGGIMLCLYLLVGSEYG
jgi:hypothetical protein